MRFKFSLIILMFTFPAFGQVKMDPSVPAGVRQQLTEDLEFVGTLQGRGTPALFQEIFSSPALNGAELLSFFNERVQLVNMDDCGGGPAVGACVRPYVDPSVMWLTQNYVTFDIPRIFRLSVVFHEARHTEVTNDFWHHATCPVPYRDESGNDIVGIISGTKMEGQAACDLTPYGSYGLQAVFLKTIEKTCSNCSDKVLMDAQLFGDDTLKRISDVNVRKSMRDALN